MYEPPEDDAPVPDPEADRIARGPSKLIEILEGARLAGATPLDFDPPTDG